MPKLSVNSGNPNSQDSQELISRPCLEFRFYRATIQQQMLIIFAFELLYQYGETHTEDELNNPIDALVSLCGTSYLVSVS